MATHSSILARKIPWTEESGRLQSIGVTRVGHDLVTKQQQFPHEELEFSRQEINCLSKKVMEVHYNCTVNRRSLEKCLAQSRNSISYLYFP